LASVAPKYVWPPVSTRTRTRTYSALPDPLAGFGGGERQWKIIMEGRYEARGRGGREGEVKLGAG